MKRNKYGILMVLILIGISFGFLFLTMRETKAVAKNIVLILKIKKDTKDEMVVRVVSGESRMSNESTFFKKLLESGNYLLYKEEFKKRYTATWKEYLDIKDDLRSQNREESIASRIRGEKQTLLLFFIIQYLIENEKTQYGEDVLYLFNNMIMPKLHDYYFVKDVYLTLDENGEEAPATAEQIDYINKRMRIDDPEGYAAYIKNMVVEAYFFNTLPKDLELSLYGVLAYLNSLSSLLEDKEEIKNALQQFLESYITLPIYVQEKPLVRKSLLIDKFFFHAYAKFNDINSYLSILFEEHESRDSASNLSLGDFNRLVTYFTDIGEGLAKEFYPLLEVEVYKFYPMRFYAAIEVLKKIGSDDPSLYPLLKDNYLPPKTVVTGSGSNTKTISLNQEIQNLKTIVKGKSKSDVDMAALYKQVLWGRNVITGPITLEGFIEDNIKTLEAVNFYRETKIRFAAKIIMLFIIHGMYLFFLYGFFIKRNRNFLVPLGITIILSALLIYISFHRLPPAALWYQNQFLAALAGTFTPVIIFTIAMRIFKKKVKMSENKKGENL